MKDAWRLGAALAAVALAACCAPAAPPADLAGTWEGDGKVIVTWCAQERLAVRLEVAPDGTVTGTVGDAELRDARLVPNRGALERELGVKTDWIVRGGLRGAVVAAEAIRRDGVSIPLNRTGPDRLAGGLHTRGRKLGGAADGILSVADLVLDRRP